MLNYTVAHVITQFKYERPLLVCRFDPAGEHVFVGGEDYNVARLTIAAADGAPRLFTGGHASWVMSLAVTKDGSQVISGGGDGRLVWWPTDAETPTPIRTVEAHQGWIRQLALSPDGTLLASAGNDRVVRIWNVADGSLVRELTGHEKHIYSVLFHPSGTWVLSGDLAGSLKQWEVATGTLTRTIDCPTLRHYDQGQMVDFGGVRAIAISPDGQYVAAGGLHKATNPLGNVHEPVVMLFRWENQELVRTHVSEKITQGVIWRLQYLADGTLMGVSGGGIGGFLLFWKPDQEKPAHTFTLPNLARDMDLHPDGQRVATVHHDRHLRLTGLFAKAN